MPRLADLTHTKQNENSAVVESSLPSPLVNLLHGKTTTSEPPLLLPPATNAKLKSADELVWEPNPSPSVSPLTNISPIEAKESSMDELVLPPPLMKNFLNAEAPTPLLEPHPPRSKPPLNDLLVHIETSKEVEASKPVVEVLLEPAAVALLEPHPPRSQPPPLHHLLVHSASEDLPSVMPAATVLSESEDQHRMAVPDTNQDIGGVMLEKPLQKVHSSSAISLHSHRETMWQHATRHTPIDPVMELALENCKESQRFQAVALAEDVDSVDPTIPASPVSESAENRHPSKSETPVVRSLEPGDPGVPPPPSKTTTLEEDNNGHNNGHHAEFLSFKAQRNVPCQTVMGAMLAGYLCATAATHDTSVFGPAAVAGFAALTRGTVGDTTRVIGDWFWSATRLSFATVVPVTDVVRTATRVMWETTQSFAEVVYAGYEWAAVVQKQQEARGVAIQKERQVRKLLQAQLEQHKKDRLNTVDEGSARNQRRGREKRMRFRFGISADERRKEESRAQEELMSRTRRHIMAYRFGLESQQRTKERAAREADLVRARQNRMAYRFELESSARSREIVALEAKEQQARQFALYDVHRKRMEYRFELESTARNEQAMRLRREIQNVRDNIIYNMHRHMLSYRFYLEAKARKEKLNAREQSFVRSHQNLMLYRLQLEAKLRRQGPDHDQGTDTQSWLLSNQIQEDVVQEQEEATGPIGFRTEIVPTRGLLASDNSQEVTKMDGEAQSKKEQNSEADMAVGNEGEDGAHWRIETTTKREDTTPNGADEFQETNDDVGYLSVNVPETTPKGDKFASNKDQKKKETTTTEFDVEVKKEENQSANDMAVSGQVSTRDIQSGFDATSDDVSADRFDEIQEEISVADDLAVAGSEITVKGDMLPDLEYKKSTTSAGDADVRTNSITGAYSNDDTQYTFETTRLSSKEGMQLKDSIVVSSSSDDSDGQETIKDKVKNVSRANQIESSISDVATVEVAAEEDGSLLVDFLRSKTGSISQTGNEAQTEQHVELAGADTVFEPNSLPSQDDVKRSELRELMKRILKPNTKSERQPELSSSEARSYRSSLPSSLGHEDIAKLASSMKSFVSPGSVPKVQGRTLNDQSELFELEVLQKAIEDRHLERARTPYARRARRLRTYLKETPLAPSTPLVQLVALHLISASAPLFTMINYRNGRKPYV